MDKSRGVFTKLLISILLLNKCSDITCLRNDQISNDYFIIFMNTDEIMRF